MNHQAPTKRASSKKAVGFLAVEVLTSTVVLLAGVGRAGAQGPPPVLVKVDRVIQRELAIGETFVGTVRPLKMSTVGSTVEARVVEFLVDAGDRVEAKQPLARLRTTQLELQLAMDKIELALRKEALAELKNVLPEQISEAKARLASVIAAREFTQSQLKRASVLSERGVVSLEELQDKQSLHTVAEQKVLENQAALASLEGSREEKLAQARLRVDEQQETIRKVEDDIAEHTIVSPFSGYVTREYTEVGQWMAKGAPVVDLVNIDQVEVTVAVSEDYIKRLRPGMIARVMIDAVREQSWQAPVSAVVPLGDERSRSFPVTIRLDNPPKPEGTLLKPGMIARVTLPVGAHGPAILVPKDAIVLGGSTPVVFVADAPPPSSAAGGAAPGGNAPSDGLPPDGSARAIARRIPVQLGAAVDHWIEVRGPLSVKDRVVVEGNEQIGFSGRPLIIVGSGSSPAKP